MIFPFAKRQIWMAIVVLMLSRSINAGQCQSDGHFLEQSIDNLELIHKNNINELKDWLGSKKDAVLAKFQDRYPGYRIMGICQGTFRRIGNREFGMGILNAETHIGIYIALTKIENKYVVSELNKFPVSFNNNGNLVGTGMDVFCPSWTEISRIKEDYFQRQPPDAAYSDLQAKSRFDAICTGTQGDAEYMCYQFDFSRKEFVEIGGWNNG